LSFEDFVTPTRAPEKNHSVSHVSSQKKKMCTRVKEKKNPQDNGDRLALIVFLTPFFGCYQFMRLAQNIWAWLIPLALPRPFHSYCFEAIQIVLSAGLRWADFGKNGLSLGLCI
jgi:hypothetical protein